MATHNDTGKKGEELAKSFLIEKGYEILASNYRYKKAEIDLIAKKGNILAIIEVKTRTSIDYGAPESFVNNKKIKLILEATNAFVIEHDLDLNISLDIISVVIDKQVTIEHIENAYYFF